MRICNKEPRPLYLQVEKKIHVYIITDLFIILKVEGSYRRIVIISVVGGVVEKIQTGLKRG